MKFTVYINERRGRLIEIHNTDKDNKLGFDKITYFIKRNLFNTAGLSFHTLCFLGTDITKKKMDEYIEVNGYKLKDYEFGFGLPFMFDLGIFVNKTRTRALRRFVSGICDVGYGNY